LIIGGLDTTAGALGHFMIRLCRQPALLAKLRSHPELIPNAVEETLRIDPPAIAVGRTVRHDVDIDGHKLKAGDKVLIYWASANRDEIEFERPELFDLDRKRNRHIAFGAGPHRCPGSNLARLNLRIAMGELVPRLLDLRLEDDDTPIEYHSALNRLPLHVPIKFTPGQRLQPSWSSADVRRGVASDLITPGKRV
jgi:cytochrome P450